MKLRIVKNGGEQVTFDNAWDVFIEHRGTTFHITPQLLTPEIEMRTEGEKMLVAPRSEGAVRVRAVPR